MSKKPTYEELEQRVKVIEKENIKLKATESALKETEQKLKDSEKKLKLHIQQTMFGVIQWNLKFEVEEWNPAAEIIFGYRKEEALGHYAASLIIPENATSHVGKVWGQLLKLTCGISSTNENVTKDGRILVCEWFNTPLVNDEGIVTGVASLVRDITDRNLTEDALRESELRQKVILNNIPDIAWLKDLDSRFIMVNEAYAEACNRIADELVGRTDLDVWPKDFAERYRADDKEVILSGKRKQFEELLQDDKKGLIWLETIKTPFRNNKGEIVGIVGIARDITERKSAEEAVKKSQIELDQIFNTAADGMRLVNKEYEILKVNETFLGITGYKDKNELVGKKCYDVFGSKTCNTDECPLNRIIKGEERIEVELEKKRVDGTRIFCILTATPFKDLNGKTVGIIEDYKDITNRKELETKLIQMSIADELTGIFNRRGFLTIAKLQLNITQRVKHELYFLYIDIDNMKWINDNLGHNAGDQALIDFASVLRKTFREPDIVGRLGGDEFAVLMHSTSKTDDRDIIVKRLQDNIKARNEQKNVNIILSISVGIVRYNISSSFSLDDIMSLADNRMYENKKKRKTNQR